MNEVVTWILFPIEVLSSIVLHDDYYRLRVTRSSHVIPEVLQWYKLEVLLGSSSIIRGLNISSLILRPFSFVIDFQGVHVFCLGPVVGSRCRKLGMCSEEVSLLFRVSIFGSLSTIRQRGEGLNRMYLIKWRSRSQVVDILFPHLIMFLENLEVDDMIQSRDESVWTAPPKRFTDYIYLLFNGITKVKYVVLEI